MGADKGVRVNIVYVRHVRCDEPRDGDFYLSPEGLTKEQFDQDVAAAQKEYLDTWKSFDAMEPQPDYAWMTYNSLDEKSLPEEMTIGTARRLRDEYVQKRKDWEAARDKTAGSFSNALSNFGYRRISDIRTWGDNPEVLVAEADWGHRHGQRFDY